jgi:hypothetical protein
MRLSALALFERANEILDLVRAEATLATGRAVRTQVTHVSPTTDGAQRNTELSRRLRRGETETIAGCDLSRHVIS